MENYKNWMLYGTKYCLQWYIPLKFHFHHVNQQKTDFYSFFDCSFVGRTLGGMQFSSEVNWSLFDFIGAGILLSIIGFTIDFVLCKTRSRNKRPLILLAIFILFLLVWIELAVGLFNTPFAGN